MVLAALCALLLSADVDVGKFDDLWTKRDDPQAAAELVTLTNGFKASTDYDKLWRASRYFYWMSDAEGGSDDARKAFAKQGWDAGTAARKLNAQAPEGKYWEAINIGSYSEAVGVLTAITQGLEGKFKDPVFEVMKGNGNHQNANLDWVGPETAIGRYYYKLPWPKHSDDHSKEWLNKAIAAHPEYLKAHYYLADTIKGDKAAAMKELTLVLVGDESYDPPEARRVKHKAQSLLAKISK